jgi:hypothetical protein
MKNLITFMILLLSCSNIPQNHTMTDYIEIKHTGREEKPIKTLIISTKEVDKEAFMLSMNIKKTLTSEQKAAILNMQYSFLIIDDTTYQSIIDFCKNNQHFFTNTINKNHGDYMDYSIMVRGNVYNIFYKLKDQFFNKLAGYIQTKKGDKSLTQKLSTY